MATYAGSMFAILLDFLFPRRSLQGSEGAWVTPAEQQAIVARPVAEETAALRRRGLQHLDRICAAASYGDCPLLQKAIRRFKYQRLPALARQLAELMLRERALSNQSHVVLCPVPLHWTRRFQRGFNQAELLARAVGRELGVPVQPLLRRRRATGHQAWRGRRERLQAVRGAFRCVRRDVPSTIVLIDDLATTGATLDACAAALKAAGAERVEGWVVAHG